MPVLELAERAGRCGQISVHADRHAAALRHLFNRLIGCLHQCLTTRQLYDETKAFPTRTPAPA
ncbi:hypothetical protein A6A27_35245 [Micromonospora sp. CB01531]|nr:hypothetical protein A6A27_35245 [Micromonospora sp. CB01531]